MYHMYRTAIVGCGRIGCAFDDDPRRVHVSTHAGAYSRASGVKLVALSDVDTTRLDRYADKFGVPGRYRDYREMLKREAIDVLSVCTWSKSHRQIAQDAVASGVKAIFCEKPIADSLEAADAMVQCCSQAGVLLMVNCQRRFDPMHQQVAALLRAGALGKIQQATCYYSGGVANNGAHLFDLLRFLLGEAAWVQGILSDNLSPNPEDPNVDGWVKFVNGPLVAVQACDAEGLAIFEVNILAARGRLSIRRFGLDLQFEEVRQSEQFSEDLDFYPAPPPVELGAQEFMLQAVNHLLDCLRSGRQPLCSGEDGRRALEMIIALRDSAVGSSRQIELPLANTTTTAIYSR